MKLRVISHNFGMKFMALLITLTLWLFVAATISTVSKFPGSIPVTIINPPENLVAIYDTREVSIKIAADPKIWRQLSSEDFTAFIDLSGLSVGVHNAKVIVNSSVPGVEIVETDPGTIMVRLENVISKEVPIAAKMVGQVAEGFTTGIIDFSPDKTTITGPKSLIEVTNIATAEIKLNGENENFERQINLDSLNDKDEVIKEIISSPTSTKATVKIVKAGNNKTVGVKVLTTGFPATGYYVSSISSDPPTLDILGQPSVLSQVQYIETQAVDLSGLSTLFSKSLTVSLPNGIALQKNLDQKVKVTINFANTEATKEITATINPTNLSGGLKIVGLDPAGVKVIITGPVSQIENIKSSDIILNLDLSGKSAGAVGINITKSMFQLPVGLSISTYLPSSISVTLAPIST